MVKAQTFKRARVIAALSRIKAKMEEAKKEAENYFKYYSEAEKDGEYFRIMHERYQSQFYAYQIALSNLQHDFGVTVDELEAKNEEP